MAVKSAQAAVASIEDFLQTVMVKSAEAHTEPGSKGGPTEHPVKDVEDGTRNATEGERSAENERDVKEDQGEASVDSTPEAKAAALLENVTRLARPTGRKKAACECGQTPCICKDKKAADGPASRAGSAADDQIQIGTNKQPTGDDPSVETSSAKSGKEDPGSKHPARTNNNELDGGKYAFDANTSWEKTAAMLTEVGNNICAQIHLMTRDGSAPAPTATTKVASAPQAQPAFDPHLARQAGWELAGLQNGTLDKQAADAMVVETIAEIIKSASDRAALTIDYLMGYAKAAAEEPPPEDPAAGGGGPPPDAMGGGGAPPDGMGGMPPEAAMGGGPPPGGGGAPGEEGGGSVPADELVQILEQLGVTPEQFAQAMQAVQGGGGGAPPPGAGGPPPGGGAPPPGGGAPPPGGAPPGMEVAAADRRATEKTAEHARKQLAEIISRSRRRAS